MATSFDVGQREDISSLQTSVLKQKPQAKPRTGRSFLTAGLIVVGVLVAGTGAWATYSWRQRAQSIKELDRFIVTPRSFDVVLKEKGELQAASSTDIKCEVEGRSTIISLVAEGKAVKKGDLLVEMASDEINDRILQEELKESNAVTAYEAAVAELAIQKDQNASDIRKSLLDIELKELALEKYEKGDWAQRLKDAEVAIEEAQIRLERAKEDYDAAKELRKRNFITQTEFEEDQFNHQKAIWELDKAKRAKSVLEKYTHVADLRQRQSDVEEAKKELDRIKKSADAEETKKQRSMEGKKKELDLTRDQLAKLRVEKQKCRIVAPTNGFVVYYSGMSGMHFMSSDAQIKEGASVHERQILLQLPDTSRMVVNIRVHEAQMSKVSLGQHASIKVEGVPDRRFSGTVTKIAALADTQNRWLNPDLKEYQTEIALDPTDAQLKPGATAHVEILVQSIENALAVPVQSVYAASGQRFVFRDDHGDINPAPIQLGATSTEWAQVKTGLSKGDHVLMAFSDDQKRLIDGTAGGPGGKAHARRTGKRGGPARRLGVRPKGSKPNHGMSYQQKNGAKPARAQYPGAGGASPTGAGGAKRGHSQGMRLRPADKQSSS